MARTEKGTRLHGLPPQLRLQDRDAHTGSFPTVFRTSRDNRTGQYRTFFDDTKTVGFGFNSGSLYPSMGLPSGSRFVISELTTSLVCSGNVVKGIGDAWVEVNPPGQYLKPFVDSRITSNDGFAVSGSNTQNQFYAVGTPESVIGPGFSQPLTAKTVIEIPLVSSAKSSINIRNDAVVNGNNPMGYWNFVSNTIEGIGPGFPWSTYDAASATSIKALLEDQTIATNYGFFSCSLLASDNSLATAAHQVSIFGFPYHNKFHAVSGSTFALTGVLSEPFLVEKMVLHLSVTLDVGVYSSWLGADPSAGIITFFVMNQRSPTVLSESQFQPIKYNIAGAVSSFYSGAYATGSYREVLGTFSYASFYEPSGPTTETRRYKNNEFGTVDGYTSSATTMNFSLPIVLSASLTSPLASTGQSSIISYATTPNTTYIQPLLQNSTRYGTYTPSGRSWLNELATLPSGNTINDAVGSYVLVPYAKKVNPYLLLPTDKLVLAVQLPYDQCLNEGYNGTARMNGIGPKLVVEPFEGRLILYGSSLRVNEEGDTVEYHDTFNQLLSSDVIHEVIGG